MCCVFTLIMEKGRNAKQRVTKKTDNQEFYYNSLAGKILGSKAREKFIVNEINHLKKEQSFLEVGCAQGYYLSKAMKKTKNVFGIDVVPSFIELAKRTKAKVSIASAEKLPYKANSFDMVLCTEVLEHVPDWKKAVKEIERVLKPKGRAIVTVPLEKSGFWKFFSIFFPPLKTRGHLNLLNSEDVKKAFSIKSKKKIFVQTMSRHLNSILPQNEGISMYVFLVFEK